MDSTSASARVSVALCTHNGARFLGEQLRSVLRQSSPPDELVVSDDRSTDETLRTVRETFETEASPATRLLIIENERPLGVTANFEQAIRATTGDLVALSDQDDVWMPDRLARAAAEFISRPELTLLHADARLVDAKGSPIGHTLFDALEITGRERELVHEGRAFEALLRRNLVTGATTMFRRSLLEVASSFPASWVHDEWLAIIAAATGRVDLLEEPLIDYRQHDANQIGAARLGLRGKFRRVMEPRAARNDRLAANFAILEDRLEELDVDSGTLGLARGKLAHERVRLGLPESRLLRVAPVLRQVRRGQYLDFSRGRGDILRDLVQPAR